MNKYKTKMIVGAEIKLCLYIINIYQIKKRDRITPRIIPGFNAPGKNGVANEETTFKMGIINMN
jgi:hypothetical protein